MNSTEATAGSPDRPELDGSALLVAGLSCQSCATKVDTAVRAVPGVTDVVVDLGNSRITVAGSASDAAITAAVTDAGYSVTKPQS